jgi:hypothetical protein
MTDLILQTDPLEFQNSRQSTKIIFLQQELQQAQDYARDLEQIVKINKEALRIATSQQPKQAPKPKSPVGNETASTMDVSSNRDNSKTLQLLVEQLQDENSKFLEIIEKAKRERNIAQSKALISEQICEESQRHESETVHELEEKITDLRKLLQDKEYAIQELEKIKAIPEQEGVVIKYREVLNPSEQNMRFHNEIDSLNGMLAKVSKELNKLQVEKHEIMSLNYNLTNELAKIRATFASPLNAPKMVGRNLIGSVGQASMIFQPVLEFLDENSPLPSPLPSNNYEEVIHTKAPVPKLDLSKAKQIQEQYAKKLTQPQQQNYNGYNANAIDKLKQLEDELELARKRLSHEMINNRLVCEELARSQKHLIQVASTNEILIKANRRYEEKWQKIFYTLEFYKEFYHKYIDLITRGPVSHMKSSSVSAPKFHNLGKLQAGKPEFESDPSQMIKDFKRANEENGKHVNVSILEANEDDEQMDRPPVERGRKPSNVFEFSKDQCKLFLLNLAKDLYVNTNLQKSSMAKKMLENLKFSNNHMSTKPIYKLKRSLSNPLEYVSERKRLVLEPNATNVLKMKNQQQEVEEEYNEEVLGNLNSSEGEDVGSPNQLGNGGERGNERAKGGKGEFDEMISFTVDPDDFCKNKMVEVSFISNHDILDQIKQ